MHPSQRKLFYRGILNVKSFIVIGIVLFEFLGWQVASAKITGQYFYGLDVVNRDNDQNEVLSVLGFGISDNLISSALQMQYNLETNWYFDHKNSVKNTQYSGNFTGRYTFIEPSLWWNYSGSIDVLPLETETEVDNFRSQTLSTVSTGPTISLWKNIRGSVELTALSSITSYSDSKLDSKGKDITLNYSYPFSEIMSLEYSLNSQTVTHDDVRHAINDFDLLTVGITINRETKVFNFELNLEHTDIDNINNSSRQNTIELIMDYKINSRSNIALEISDSLQSAAEFNRLNDNSDNSIFRSGLVRNKRLQLDYRYDKTDIKYTFQLFTNQFENIFDEVATSDEINGAVFRVSNDLNDDVNLLVKLKSTDDTNLNQRADELIVTATYTRQHNHRVFSQLAFTLEHSRVDNVDSTDEMIQYRITSTFF